MIKKLKFSLMAIMMIFSLTMCDKEPVNPNEPDRPGDHDGDDVEVADPVIKAEKEYSIGFEGGLLEIAYRIENPVEGQKLTVKVDERNSWIEYKGDKDGKLSFNILPLEGNTRNGSITLSYEKAENLVIAVKQTPKEIPGGAMTFEIKIKDIQSEEVTFDLLPSDKERTFVAHVAEKSKIDKVTDWNKYFEQQTNQFIEDGQMWGAMTEEDAIAMYLRQGDMIDYRIPMLSSNTEYCIVAYGMDLDKTITSYEVTLVPFKTEQIGAVDMTFDMKIKNCLGYTRMYVTPSSTSHTYYWSVMPKSEFEAAGETLAQDIVDDLMRQVDNENVWMSEFLNAGVRAMNKQDLLIGEKYVLFAFGCHFKGIITTPVFTYEFIPEELQKVDCDFQIKKDRIRSSYFSVKIQPSDPNVRWFAYTLPHKLLDDYYISAEDMTDDALDASEVLGVNWEEDLYVHTGDLALISYEMLGDAMEAGTTHFIGVMGVNEEGVRVTDLATLKITTLEDCNKASDMKIDINVRFNEGLARAEFTPDQKEIYFYDLVSAEVYDVDCEGDDKTFIDNILIHYASSEMLKNKLAYIPSFLETPALVPGEEYYAVAFGYDSGATTQVYKHRFTYTGQDSASSPSPAPSPAGAPAPEFNSKSSDARTAGFGILIPKMKPLEKTLYKLMVRE